MNNLSTLFSREKHLGSCGNPALTGVLVGASRYQQFEKVMSLPPDPPRDDDGVILKLIFDNQWSKDR
jgi:hypothetical protein